jgi:DNA polymerase I-like protein with 3'-5' exonuclease and polymerase domains
MAHYSQDPNYLNATLYMKGKRPHYDRNGLLVIADPYLMASSRFPKWAPEIRDAFETTYDGVSGFDIWVQNKSLITDGVLKDLRPKTKTIGLAIIYGLGPKNMVLHAAKNGFEMSYKDTKAYFKLFWDTFRLAKVLGEKLEIQYNSKGYILNDFGYALYPDAGYKCLNALVQSTVSGLVDYVNYKFFTRCQEAEFVTVIHDEVVFQVPENKTQEIKKIFYQTLDEVNAELGWTVKVSFGWKESKTFFVK